MRRAAKRDTTERPAVQAMRKAGALVMYLDKFDLLVYHRRKLFMLDAKTGKGKATEAQQRLIEQGWPLQFVHDEIEALSAIGCRAIQAVSDERAGWKALRSIGKGVCR